MPSRSKSEKDELRELIVCLIGCELTIKKYIPQLHSFTLDELISFYSCLEQFRYVHERRQVPKSHHWLETILPSQEFGEKRFRQQMRMSRDAFCYVTGLITGCSSFTDCQDPVPIQLAVALFQLGTFGNGSSIGHAATKFGISEGAVGNSVSRVISALHELSNAWIKWPDVRERQLIGSTMAFKYFPKCVGFIDGSDATFYQAPQHDKQTYWSRKKKYCMQFQIVCDPNKLIRSLFTGYPGSVHDAKVYANSPVLSLIHNYFSNDEYILGDSAYPNSNTLIVPFRRKLGGHPPNQRKFNRQLASERVAVEHTIGILKGRFKSLQGLRINVNKAEGHRKVCLWIEACSVLHNMLMKFDPWTRTEDEIFQEPEFDDLEDENPFHSQLITGGERRAAISAIINTMC